MRSSRKQSFLTYPLARHYPFPWVDWVVTIFLTVCLVLFTIINLATTGYTTQTVYTLDPNGTIAQKHWFEKAPWSWLKSESASCQGSPIANGSSVFTTNLGLLYTVSEIWQGDGQNASPFPWVPYLNTTLDNCTVTQVDVQLQRREYSQLNTQPANFWTWDSSWATAEAQCNIIANSKIYTISFVASLPTIRESDNHALLQMFVNLTHSTRPAIWLGANLRDTWYERVAVAMSSQETFPNDTRLDSAQMLLTPNDEVSDVTSPDFFYAAGVLYPNANGIFVNTPPNMTIGDLQQYTECCADVFQSGRYKLGQIAANIDLFAKSFYATILADLGQNYAFHFDPSVHGAEYLITALGNVSQGVGGSANTTFVGLPTESAWDTLKDSTPLTVNPATIYTEYACTVPKIKDTPSLLVSIFIADLVLLQAAWQIAMWVLSHILESKDPQMHNCRGCVSGGNDQVPLVGKTFYNRIDNNVIS